ncbi:MAG TPA: ATP-binding protein [Actinotalea sp.]|nr:ATP-binding protein [Actinotalea sp.]
MTAERERRTSSGSTLRLVGEAVAAAPAAEVPAQRTEPLLPGHRAVDLVLPGQRQSVAVGRHWVVRTVLECGVDEMANQVVELLCSELLANAVLHGSEGGAIAVQVHHSVTVLRVSVSDAGSRTPVVLHTEPSAPNGRGMAIVEAMSSRWGVDEHADGGKTVWFELDLADY